MNCCFKRKSSASKSGGAAQPAAAAQLSAPAQQPTHPVLNRILSCQSGRWNDSSAPCPTFEQALREITAGRKASHWMWYIWPSLTGIRTTSKPDLMIPDLQCAIEYLSHPKLGPRLVTISQAAHAHLRAGLPPSTLFGPMAHVDSEKFHEVMTCFYIAAQSAGDAVAGSVFEKCMHAIATALRRPASGGMHMPTVQLLQGQLPVRPAPPPPAAVGPVAAALPQCARAGGGLDDPSMHALSSGTGAPAAAAREGLARGGDGVAVDSDESPAIVLSKADRFIGYPSKDVARALQKQFPHAKIEIVRDGQKVAGVRNDRILIFADSYDEVARGPTVG